MSASTSEYRSGFMCLVGRPNAGKSTLTNALVGTKVAITSDRPQTTRRVVRGIVTTDTSQLIIVDTPGMHRPRTLLGERLNDLIRSTWAEVDVIGFCLAANETTGPGDRKLAADIAAVQRNKVIVVIVTKTDIANGEQVAQRLVAAQELAESVGLKVAQYIPVSATAGSNLDVLLECVSAELPPGPKLFPDGEITDESTEQLVAELIREAALKDVVEELPHSIAVTIDEMGLREDRPADRPLMDIHATIHVERSSQKPIVIGKGGQRLKETGSIARASIERLLAVPVYLNLHVRVAKEWQRDPKQLRRLGF